MLSLCPYGERLVKDLEARGKTSLGSFYENNGDLSTVQSFVYVFPEAIAKSITTHLGKPVNATFVDEVNKLWKPTEEGSNFSLISTKARLCQVIGPTVITHKIAGGRHFIVDGPSSLILTSSEAAATATNSSRQSTLLTPKSSRVLS